MSTRTFHKLCEELFIACSGRWLAAPGNSSILTHRTDLVDRQVGAVVFLFLTQANAQRRLEQAVHHEATDQRNHYAQRSADHLAGQADATQATECFEAEDAAGDATPDAAQAMQRPDAENVVDFLAILRERECPDEQSAGNRSGSQRAQRVHDIGAGANCN